MKTTYLILICVCIMATIAIQEVNDSNKLDMNEKELITDSLTQMMLLALCIIPLAHGAEKIIMKSKTKT